LLMHARHLPAHDEMVIEDLTPHDGAEFFAALERRRRTRLAIDTDALASGTGLWFCADDRRGRGALLGSGPEGVIHACNAGTYR
jgi:hypothetical protein